MSKPSRWTERLIGWLLPAERREDVLGDLHQRYRSPLQYLIEAMQTVPVVIASRARRTSDPQIILMQTAIFLLAFLGTAWMKDPALLDNRGVVFRLASLACAATAGMMLDAVYATNGRRRYWVAMAGPMVGVGIAAGSMAIWHAEVPVTVLVYGTLAGLLMASAVRFWLGIRASTH